METRPGHPGTSLLSHLPETLSRSGPGPECSSAPHSVLCKSLQFGFMQTVSYTKEKMGFLKRSWTFLSISTHIFLYNYITHQIIFCKATNFLLLTHVFIQCKFKNLEKLENLGAPRPPILVPRFTRCPSVTFCD